MAASRENRPPAERMSEGKPSALVREHPHASTASGDSAADGRAWTARTGAEAQKWDGGGTRPGGPLLSYAGPLKGLRVLLAALLVRQAVAR